MQSRSLFYKINDKLSHNYIWIYAIVFALGLISYAFTVSQNLSANITIEPVSPISWITFGFINANSLPYINGALLLFGNWLFFRSLLKRLSFLALFFTLFTLAANQFLFKFIEFDFSFNLLFVALSIFLYLFFKLDDKIKTPFTPPRKVVKYWMFYYLSIIVLLFINILFGWIAVCSLFIYLLINKRWFSLAITIPTALITLLLTWIINQYFPSDLQIYKISFQPITVLVDGVTNFYFASTLPTITAKYIAFALMLSLFVFQFFLLAIRNRAFLFVWIFIIVSFVIFSLYSSQNNIDDRYLYLLLPYINAMFMITVCQTVFKRNWLTSLAVISGILFTTISLMVTIWV